MRLYSYRLALILFALYAAVFPGSTITLALDRVPEWGIWMGNVLLILQGLIMLAWMTGRYGGPGLLAGLLIGMLAFLIEFVGVVTAFPFGRYVYTDVLQPQILGVVPLAICCAWLLVVPTAFEIARRATPGSWAARHPLITTATLVLLLDLQIETVAASINGYWIWLDPGPYYGVPTANFVAWWLVGLGMAWVIAVVALPALAHEQDESLRTTGASYAWRVCWHIPLLLYGMNVGMFTVVNLSRGYAVAGLVGLAILVGAGGLFIRRRPRATAATLNRSVD